MLSKVSECKSQMITMILNNLSNLLKSWVKFLELFFSLYGNIEFRCHNMNKCNKTSAFPILKHYTQISFIFIIYSNDKSFGLVKCAPNQTLTTGAVLRLFCRIRARYWQSVLAHVLAQCGGDNALPVSARKYCLRTV